MAQAQLTPEEARRELARRELERRERARRRQDESAPQARSPGGGPRPEPERVYVPYESERKVRAGDALEEAARNTVVGTAGMYGALGNLAANIPGLGGLENTIGFQGQEHRLNRLVGDNTYYDPSLNRRMPYRARNRAENALEIAGELPTVATTAGLVRRATTGGSRLLPSIGRSAVEETIPTAAGVGVSTVAYGRDFEPLLTGGTMLGLGVLGPSTQRITQDSGRQSVAARAPDPTTPEGRMRYDEAERVARRAQEMGFPITPAEALKSDALGRLAGRVSLEPEGAALNRRREIRQDATEFGEGDPVRTQRASDLPDQSFRQLMRQVVQEQFVNQPRPVSNARARADEAVQSARNQINREVQPYYEAARQRSPEQTVPVEEVRALDAEIARALETQPAQSDGRRALEALRRNLRRPDGQFETNAGTLDLVYRDVRERADAAMQDPRAGVELGVGATAPFIQPLRRISGMNENIAEARRLTAQRNEELVVPLTDYALAGIYGEDGTRLKRARETVTRLLNNDDIQYGDFQNMVNRMADVEGGREAIESLTGAYITRTVDDALTNTPTGPRGNPSAKFSSMIQGTERRNLYALLDALDEADQRRGLPRANRRQAFRNVMDVLDRTAYDRRPLDVGVSDSELAGAAGNWQRRLLAVARPLATPASFISGQVADARRNNAVRNSWRQIADALTQTGPEGVRAVRRVATENRGTRPLMRAVGELLLVRGPMVEQETRVESEE